MVYCELYLCTVSSPCKNILCTQATLLNALHRDTPNSMMAMHLYTLILSV